MSELQHYHPPQVTRVLARDGSVLAELFVERRTLVPIDRIPQAMKLCVLAAEDADFYEHAGLDYLGMLRALYVNVRTGHARQGGSTITQQVVKNVLLTPERTFARKAREVLLARRIEQTLTKDEILELYLNHIYFGHGRYGVEEASRYYFGKGIADVSLAEAALLAGLAKAPNIYSPRVNLERARKRRNQVLEQLAAKGFADPEQTAAAQREPIVLAPEVETLAELAPEVVEEVRRTLHELVGSAVSTGGYVVTTTIDPHLQAAARRAVRANLDRYAERHHLMGPIAAPRATSKGRAGSEPSLFHGVPKVEGHHVYRARVLGADDAAGILRVRVGTVDGAVRLSDAARYNPRGLPPSRFAEVGAEVRVSARADHGLDADGVPHEFRLELGPQSALVAVDVASREIRALVGSYEAIRAGLDRASFAHRQPGSTFKPFVYGYGLHTRRLTAATAIGSPSAEPSRGADELAPAEASPRDAGAAPSAEPPLRVRAALARSVNHAAQWALGEVGAEGVVAWAHSLGVASKLGATESLALGAYEVTPRELAAAYATFAAGGSYQPLVLISSIVGPDGRPVKLPSRPPPHPVMSPAEAYVLTSLLTSVVQEGTAQRARSLGRSIAGKTGTSNDSRDAWFAGYSTDLTCVVWTGYDDAAPLGAGEAGATAALPAFVDFMREAHRQREPRRFEMPEGVVRVAIDPLTGLLAYERQDDAVQEVFVAGTEPTETALAPDGGLSEPPDGSPGPEPSPRATAGGGRGGAEPFDPLRWDDSGGADSASDVYAEPPVSFDPGP